MQKMYFSALVVLSIVVAIGGIALFGRLTDINPDAGLYIGEIFFSAGLVGWVWLFVPVFRKRLTITMLSIGSMIIFGTAFGVAGIVPGGMMFVVSLMLIIPNQAPPSDVL